MTEDPDGAAETEEAGRLVASALAAALGFELREAEMADLIAGATTDYVTVGTLDSAEVTVRTAPWAAQVDRSTLPGTVYLSDEGIHDQVEAVVSELLATAGLQIRRARRAGHRVMVPQDAGRRQGRYAIPRST
jgi:hypothetical protein